MQDRASTAAPHAPAPLFHPPRPELAFRVGVVGHRPDRLPSDPEGQAALQGRLTRVMAATRAAVEAFAEGNPDAGLYADGAPRLRAVSSLAEGADRWLAEAALADCWALCAPLPFPREEFERDFTGASQLEPDSVERFRALLAAAEQGAGIACFEVDGSRDDEEGAYAMAARAVLNQSDLLVVVWDGEGSRGRGGTVDTIRQAVRFHVPTLWIHARAPWGWQILRHAVDLACLDGEGPCAPSWIALDTEDDNRRLDDTIRHIVHEELACPSFRGETKGEARAKACAYLDEVRPAWNWAFAWKTFRDLVGSNRIRVPPLKTRDFVDQAAAAWPGEAGVSAQASPGGWINLRLRAPFAWADQLADIYADAHRTAFVVSSLFAAVAVLLALLPVALGAMPGLDAACAVGELLVIAVMLFLLQRRPKWHERWLEYRVLAELLREARLLVPLGGGRPLPRHRPHLATYGDPGQSWMYWYVRSILRHVGLPSARVDAAYRRAGLELLADIVAGPSQGQKGFHETTWRRSERIHERLHRATLILFLATLGGVVLHLLLSAPAAIGPILGDAGRPLAAALRPLDEGLGPWLVVLCAFAPALGAAIANIDNQGEFVRLAKRSHAMRDVFETFEREIATLRDPDATGEPAPSLKIADLAARIADRMIEENLDWRVVVLDLPHVAG
jgi:hypothetical protein